MGRGVFNGNVKVKPRAVKTDAQQFSKNLLLNSGGTINAKPNLQIYADDVKCTHGCAVADLNEYEMFYFATRGIDKHSARQALVKSFGMDVVQKIELVEIRGRIEDAIRMQLNPIYFR